MKTNILILILLTLLSTSCSKDFLNNCDSKSSAYLKPKARFTINPDGKNVQFINESENAESFEWDFGNNEKLTDKNPSKDFNENKTYTVKLTAKRCGGEIVDIFTSNVKIDCPDVVGPIIAINGNSTICSGQSIQLSSSCPSGNTLIWGVGQTTSAISVTSSGTYSATCKNTATGCLSKTSEKVVSVISLPNKPVITNNLNKISFCTGETLPTLSSSCPSGSTLSWSTGVATTSINVSAAGTYSATCKNITGCTANSDNAVITINSKPTAPTISTNSDNQCNNVSFTLTASACVGGIISWATGSTPLGSGVSLQQSITSNKNYTATCTVNDCSSTSPSKTIFVIPLAIVATEKADIDQNLLSYNITFKGTLNFQTATNIGEVKEYGFVYTDGDKDPKTINNPTKIIYASSTKNATRLLEKNLSNTSYSSDKLPFTIVTYKVSYRAYIVRCDGSIFYGDLLKTFN
jgi:PKD domain